MTHKTRYGFEAPKEGESLSDYLKRHNAHPKQKNRMKMSVAEAKKLGTMLPDDHPVFTKGIGVGFTKK